MNIISNAIRLSYTESGKAEIILSTDLTKLDISKEKEIISKGKLLNVDIKQYRQKRSIEANGYCWLLCQKIAEVIKSTKELVYQQIIKDVGQFSIVPVRNDVVESYIRKWKAIGLGWHAESLGDSKLKGYTNIISYFGSSVYNTREMYVLLSEIISRCHELGIETLTPDEIANMNSQWGDK